MGDHVPHQVLPREKHERQSSPQRGCGERDERRVSRALLFILGVVVVELEVLEVREETNEIQDLLARALGLFEGKEPERRREMSKAPSNVWHESEYLEMIYSKILEVRECGKVTQRMPVEPSGSEFIIISPQTDPESLDEWKQTKLV